MHSNYRDRDLLDLAYRIECTLLIPGVCVGGYPKRWKPVFEWLLAELHEASDRAARQFAWALSNDPPRLVA